MKNKFSLNIDNPCSEDFNNFSSTAKGGFCDSCKKEVIDFSKMNSDEIIQYFKKGDVICGRFKPDQLKVYEKNHPKRKYLSFFSGIGLAYLSFFNSGNIQAQEIKSQEDPNQKPIEESKQQQEYITVKGTVVDELGPVAGANVVLEGTAIGTTTDFDGNFEFPEKLKKGDVLLFSYVGLESKKVIMGNENSNLQIELNVNMSSCTLYMMGKVAKKGVYSSKKKK
ncbi:hypothetical protein DI487_04725 [Flavobacterium sediminis]|uniref:TonB-dependent receptor n=1 Tax=Flavobacterium sediminis TaxID=2201181 RepID=A0A2U8QSU1_9FLAO|nr:carboxypeptidase-like regulatory domain-containing protein [Flavobacterium sediminis]AWM13237.1 hypothetical protein DI487_04725 [Flavobacterium sediminis]